ncbi:hypothetical protein TNCV_1105961 [Trichonephila clavipes]|nr:hypothetical protein TNCV_1105961 [Trichonephila clavipes]
MTGKDILKCVQSSKSIIDTDSDGENASSVLKSSEMRNVMKKTCGEPLGMLGETPDCVERSLKIDVEVILVSCTGGDEDANFFSKESTGGGNYKRLFYLIETLIAPVPFRIVDTGRRMGERIVSVVTPIPPQDGRKLQVKDE